MDISDLKVKIYNDEKCIYEHEIPQSNENDLKMLLGNLQDIQSKVNNFLTALIEQQDDSGNVQSNSR
jgi:hypothetical protein